MGGHIQVTKGLKSCEMYDIKQNKWTEIASMSTERDYCASVSRGEIIDEFVKLQNSRILCEELNGRQ